MIAKDVAAGDSARVSYEEKEGKMTAKSVTVTAPAKKEQEPPPDELEQLLDDVTDFVNGEGHA